MVENEKILFFHYDYQKYEKSYIRIEMEPTANYKFNMLPWKSTKKQKYIMSTEKCDLKFKIVF